jgi:hypothetical protein
MQLMEQEDGMLSRSSVKQLRDKLGREAYDVVADQRCAALPESNLRKMLTFRVGCMIQGAWFNSASVIVNGIISSHKAVPAKPLRFVKLVSLFSAPETQTSAKLLVSEQTYLGLGRVCSANDRLADFRLTPRKKCVSIAIASATTLGSSR